jgi:predicted nucleotidyltransferase component of viral defense system
MKNSDFDGLRVRLSTTYIDIETMIQIDVCKADKVVPNPIEYEIPSSIGDSKPFKIYGYSVSTVLAEKLHAILSLGGFTSRMKDYYDVYMLTKNNKYDKNEVRFAFKSILSERKDLSIYENKEDTLREIEKSDEIKISWQHYQIRYPYAANISFDDVFFVVKTLALSL